MGVNIKGVFFMSQLAGKVMLKQGKGKIINIASTNSFIGLRNMPAYVSSKGDVYKRQSLHLPLYHGGIASREN